MAGRPFSEDELLIYVRGASSPALADRIEAMMARDPALRAEIALMRGLKPALADADTGQPPGEFGWTKLQAAIRRDEAQRHRGLSRRQLVVWRVAAAFLGVAVLGQIAYIASAPMTVDDATYRTASEPTEAHVLGIGFAPDANAAEIGALLRAANARIIDGPSVLGLYRVAFPSADALQAGQAQFRASTVIDLIAAE
jgi:hypothetical protein